jgi:hypothetical protein
MNWDAIGAIGEIIGAVAVIATLIYLARQIQQSNRIALAESEISLRNSFGIANQAIYSDAELAKIVTKAQSANVEFDPVELTRLRTWLTQGINIWLSVEAAYSNGMAPEKTYEVVFDDARQFVQNFPGALDLMRQIMDTYPAMSDSKIFQHCYSLIEQSSDGGT